MLAQSPENVAPQRNTLKHAHTQTQMSNVPICEIQFPLCSDNRKEVREQNKQNEERVVVVTFQPFSLTTSDKAK